MMRVKRSPITIMTDVLFALLLREFLTRFGNRRMGAFWMIFEPMLHVAVMMFIFSVIRVRTVQGMEYPLFLLSGIVPFFMMRNIAKKLMDSVSANQALFVYPNIKIFDTYIARAIIEIFIYTIIYCIFLFCLGFWFHYDVSINRPIGFMAALLIGILFSFGLGILLSILVQVFPNVKTFVGVVFTILYFMSGVLFPLWIIPEQYLKWLLWNPYAHILSNIRESAFIHYPVIQGVSWSYPIIATVVVLFIAIGLYRIRKDRLLMK